jgi:hypothetical protein
MPPGVTLAVCWAGVWKQRAQKINARTEVGFVFILVDVKWLVLSNGTGSAV